MKLDKWTQRRIRHARIKRTEQTARAKQRAMRIAFKSELRSPPSITTDHRSPITDHQLPITDTDQHAANP